MQKDLVYLANNYEYEMSHFYISDILMDCIMKCDT